MFESAPILLDLIRDYDGYLCVKKGRARSEPHRKRVTLYLERMVWGAEKLEDVTSDWVEDRLGELLELPVPPTRTGGEHLTVSRNTVDTHRSILGTFFRWLTRKRGWQGGNPVEFVDPFDREDARGVSRSFTVAELRAFWPVVPRSRLLTYLTWATTGLRPSESRRLPWPEVILDPTDSAPEHLLLRRSLTKNGRPERQPLRPRLAALLRDARTRAGGVGPVFPTIPTNATFARDLRAAGLWTSRETAEGKLTRYSLRKTFVTGVVSDERSSAVAHKLARHSDPKLTFGTYTTVELRRKWLALESIDHLFPDPEEAAA